jgi:hypothetical protein
MNHFARTLIGSDGNDLEHLCKGFDERVFVDSAKHKEANRAIGSGDEKYGVDPRGVIRSEESSTTRGNKFLPLQVQTVNGVSGDPEKKTNQGVGEKPKDVSEGAECTDRGPKENSPGAEV